MNNFLRKIPLVIWLLASLLVGLLALIKFDHLLSGTDTKLVGGFFAMVGLFFVAIQTQATWKNNRITNEFLNQPNFNFLSFAGVDINTSEREAVIDSEDKLERKFEDVAPKKCGDIECRDDHWFTVVQTGKIPPLELRIALFHEQEMGDISFKEIRWLDAGDLLYENDNFQYKLPEKTIPAQYYRRGRKNTFYILMEYKLAYFNTKFKRVYSISGTGHRRGLENESWVGRIAFYSVRLSNLNSDSMQTVPDILAAWWKWLLIACRIKRSLTIGDWIAMPSF